MSAGVTMHTKETCIAKYRFPLEVMYHIGVGSNVVCSTELGNAKASKTWYRQQVSSHAFFMFVDLLI